MKRTVTVILSLALALQSVPAIADDDADAKKLFDDARDLAKANKWPEACEKLVASKRLAPRMLTTYRLADCHERIGKTASAHAGFLEAADLAKATGDSTKQQDALERAKKAESKLAKITLDLPKEEGLSMTIDDVVIAPALAREKLPLDPGSHTLVVTATGKESKTVTFDVPQGPSVTAVTVPPLEAAAKVDEKKKAPEPDPVAPPIEEAKPETSGSGLKTVGFVALGVGAIGLGVGTALGLSAKSLDGDAEKLCTPRGCTTEGKQMNDDARSRGNVATIVFTAGALIAVTGVVLILVAPKKTETTATTARLAPWAAPNGGGLTIVGSF